MFEKHSMMGLVLSSALLKISKLLPKMGLPVHILPSILWECPFACILTNTWYYQKLVFPNLMGVRWQHFLVFICMPLTPSEVSSFSYAYCSQIPFFCEVHVSILCQCLNWVALIDLQDLKNIYVLDINPLWVICVANVLYQSVAPLFTLFGQL